MGRLRHLVTLLIKGVRGWDADALPTPPQAVLYHGPAPHPPAGDAIDIMRFRAWKALLYSNQAALSKTIARQLCPLPLLASVTRIESFAACPFKHFARYALGLRQREDEEAVSSLDLGNVFHHVLETIVKDMLAEKK